MKGKCIGTHLADTVQWHTDACHIVDNNNEHEQIHFKGSHSEEHIETAVFARLQSSSRISNALENHSHCSNTSATPMVMQVRMKLKTHCNNNSASHGGAQKATSALH